jgi:hypothetical protein
MARISSYATWPYLPPVDTVLSIPNKTQILTPTFGIIKMHPRQRDPPRKKHCHQDEKGAK